MAEYEKVASSSDAHAAPAERAGASQAMQRLKGQLGQVQVPRQGKDGCVYDTIWMPPGNHLVKVEGQSTPVTVRAGATVKMGECK
jgi:hypothetical protein